MDSKISLPQKHSYSLQRRNEERPDLFSIRHDPLMLILDNFTYLERIRLERVSKGFQSLVWASFGRISDLDFTQLSRRHTIVCRGEKNRVALSLRKGLVRGLVERCSPKILRFSTSGTRISYSTETARNIFAELMEAQQTCDLQTLYLDGINFRDPSYPDGLHSIFDPDTLENFRAMFQLPCTGPLRVLDFEYAMWNFSVTYQEETNVHQSIENSPDSKRIRMGPITLNVRFGQYFPSPNPTARMEFERRALYCRRENPRERKRNIAEFFGKEFGKKMDSLRLFSVSGYDGIERGESFNLGKGFAEYFPNLRVLELTLVNIGSLEGISESSLEELRLNNDLVYTFYAKNHGEDSPQDGKYHLSAEMSSKRDIHTRLEKHLKVLEMDYSGNYTEDDFAMLRKFRNIERLSMNRLRLEHSGVDQFWFDDLFRNFPKLKHLLIKHSPKVCDSTLAILGAYCPGLESLDIRSCDNVSSKGVSALKALLPTVIKVERSKKREQDNVT